jgi:hypothetical protein
LRNSATATSTPRQARSMASVRPTGPAPTMRTLVSIWRFIFDRNIGGLHELSKLQIIELAANSQRVSNDFTTSAPGRLPRLSSWGHGETNSP